MGLCLHDIQAQFSVSRRTAERMRDTVGAAFDLEEVQSDERQKRWRLPAGTINHLITYTAEEIQELNLAIDAAKSHGEDERAAILEGLRTKLTASLGAQAQRRIEPDIEALMESEGLALRPGPKPKIASETLRLIRRALMQKHMLSATYRSSDRTKTKAILVEPHGLFFSTRPFLVAFEFEQDVPKLYALDGLNNLTITSKPFIPRETFNLKKFAERSFGTFQETPEDIVWTFKPATQPPVEDFCFHPNQVINTLADGAVSVAFTCGGFREMAWHLFTWGDKVQSITPSRLRDEYIALLKGALENMQCRSNSNGLI